MLNRSFQNYFTTITKIFESIEIQSIENLILEIKKVKANKGLIYVIGNGGSSALASHFATDLGSGSVLRGQDFPVVSLVDNSPIITAAANDFGFEQIFARQLVNLGNKKDLLIAISSSGNSTNLVEAILQAKKIGMKSVAITGFDGGKISSLADVSVHIRSEIGEYGQVEDVHSIILHAISMHLRAGN